MHALGAQLAKRLLRLVLKLAAFAFFAYALLYFGLIFSFWACSTTRTGLGGFVLYEGTRVASDIRQAEQRPWIVLVLPVTASETRSCVCIYNRKRPAVQSAQIASPDEAANLPGTQDTHAAAPVLLWYLPMGHCLQLMVPLYDFAESPWK